MGGPRRQMLAPQLRGHVQPRVVEHLRMTGWHWWRWPGPRVYSWQAPAPSLYMLERGRP